MKSVSQHQFARIPAPKISRSKFDRSSPFKTTFDAGVLFPIFIDEALPGDSFKLKTSLFCRLNTPIVPIMDNAYLETFFFEIPYRQVWENWAKFCGEQDAPNDSTDYLIPQVTAPAGGFTVHSLADYFGLPLGIDNLSVSALPFRASNHVFNTWFRDQNLQSSINVKTDDGPDPYSDYGVQRRGKRPDYFTSSLPWPQKSDSGSVQIPLGDSAPVISRKDIGGDGIPVFSGSTGTDINFSLDTGTTPGQAAVEWTQGTQAIKDPMEWADTQLVADLTSATAATINVLRQSIAIQRLFEKDARGGTRLIEVIENHFGVRSPDLRLQRPGYLGGGRSQLMISPVAQTTPSEIVADITPKGDLSAIGVIAGGNHGFTKSFTEHTIIIGYGCVRADINYQRGINRMWSRLTRFDHYWPELATIGEQSVLRKEIWADGTAADNDVWSYQERHAEYRYKPGTITGKFRSTDPTSLDYWHLTQDFETEPVLNGTFILENPPFDRVIATPNEPQFKMDCVHSLTCVRPMPMYGIPGLDRL